MRESVANRTKSEQDLENARRTVAQAVREAFIAVNTGLSEIKALEQAVTSNKLSVEASKLGQEVGVRTQVDVLNALSLLFDAQRNLVRAYYVTIVGQLRLKAPSAGSPSGIWRTSTASLQWRSEAARRKHGGALADKAAVRRAILSKRDAVPAARRAVSSAAITKHLLDLPAFTSAEAVLAYLSFGSEYDTRVFSTPCWRRADAWSSRASTEPIGGSSCSRFRTRRHRPPPAPGVSASRCPNAACLHPGRRSP